MYKLRDIPDLVKSKYAIVIVLIVLLVVGYAVYRYRKSRENVVSKPREKRSQSKAKPKSKGTERMKNNAVATDDDDADDNVVVDVDQSTTNNAQELFNLVHDRMVNDMKSEEFSQTAGNLADSLTYVELKQLYNDAKNKNQDASRSVTIEHYVNVLDKRKDGDGPSAVHAR